VTEMHEPYVDVVFGVWTKRSTTQSRKRECPQCGEDVCRAERIVWQRSPFTSSGTHVRREQICVACLAARNFEPVRSIDSTKER